MVSQDSPPHPDTTNILHQFITTQNQFDHHHHHHHHHHNHHHHNHDHNHQSQHFDHYDSSNNNPFVPHHHHHQQQHHSLGLFLPNDIQPHLGGGEESAEMSHTRRLMDLLGATTSNNADTTRHSHSQRLSLSLNSHNILVQPQYDMLPRNLTNPNYLLGENDDYPFASAASSSSSAAAATPMSRQCSSLYGSRYLKPTQSLLEEIVNVGGREVDFSSEKYLGKVFRGSRRGGLGTLSAELRAELCSSAAVSTDKQEAQVKLAKLISLLEEVDNRYEKYYHQMEEVMSTFEVIAGQGSAKSYTGLALQAMSRHFCSLRDAVVSRINSEKRKLAQDFPKISAGLSQLSLFDRDSKSKNNNSNSNSGNTSDCNRIASLQQLGLIQTQQRQAWRPIRGLPETSVAILRAWLFEHFLHPYPNDSEKLMLASQTGLSKNQVSNWFINARVRLWKPMIEEMYKEEFGDSSEDSNPSGVIPSAANEGVDALDREED